MPRGESGNPPGRTGSEHRSASATDAWIETFHARLKERGLKSTAQRDDIARVFYRHGRHVSAEELFVEVRKVSPHVGYATIYRTLKLLRECELVYERHFNDGQARYEAVGERHHDHFICDRCGRIIEFENPRIERLQEIVARELGALLLRHKMELYGLCASCRERSSRA